MYLSPRIGLPLLILFLMFNASVLVYHVYFGCPVVTKTLNENVVDLQLLKFNDYIIQFNKTYTDREYHSKLRNFKASLAEIARLNALEGRTVFGLTEFADMSAEEFAERMLSKRIHKSCTAISRTCNRYKNNTNNTASAAYLGDLFDKFDWRDKGIIGPIQNQRQGCAACWAFSIIGAMESMAAIQNVTVSLQPRSIQELIDCSTYNTGCHGGNIHLALDFLCDTVYSDQQLGIVGQEEYPLTLKVEDCKMPKSGRKIWLESYAYRCKMNEDDLARQIMQGPVITIVNAVSWQYYLGGIIWRGCFRNERSMNHDVQIVGFDKTGDIPYYIVRNSWGKLFGDHGYVKIAMYENVCGIAEEVSAVKVK